jgi:hypothetical protein
VKKLGQSHLFSRPPGALSRCFYDAIKAISLAAVPRAETCPANSDALPALISTIQTYGDDPIPFHPRLHCLVADGLLLPGARGGD